MIFPLRNSTFCLFKSARPSAWSPALTCQNPRRSLACRGTQKGAALRQGWGGEVLDYSTSEKMEVGLLDNLKSELPSGKVT